MKNIILKKCLWMGIVSCLFMSCSDDILDEINKSPNVPTDVPISLLLPQAITSTITGIAGGGIGEYSSFFVEHTTNVHLNPKMPYDINSYVWTNIYATLNDLKIIIDKGSVGGTEEGKFFEVGIAKIMYAYTLSIGTDFFDDMPHSKALQGSLDRTPDFDDQETIYAFLQSILDEAVIDINKGSLGDVERIDLIFQGDPEMWVKTAYALKARLYNRLSNIDAESSVINTLDALAKAYTSEDEGLIFDLYITGSANDNPWAGWQKNEDIYAVSKTFVDLLNSYNDSGYADPRAEIWFTKIDNEFVGAPAGESESDLTHVLYSAPSENVLFDESPQPLLTYDEMKFIEAEVLFRSGTIAEANAAYEEAVRSACKRSGISETDINAYVNQGKVFPGESGLTLDHIIEQKYISFWMFQSIEAYNDFRRTGIPQMNDPRGTPLRLAYPPTEISRNPNTPSDINDITIYDISIWWGQP